LFGSKQLQGLKAMVIDMQQSSTKKTAPPSHMFYFWDVTSKTKMHLLVGGFNYFFIFTPT